MSVIAYCRVGTNEQSLDGMRERLELFAHEEKLIIKELFIDKGYSSNQERPEFAKVRQLLNDGGATLITLKANQMYRNFSELLKLLDETKNAGSRIITADGSIDTDNEVSYFIEALRNTIAVIENDHERNKKLLNVFNKRKKDLEIDEAQTQTHNMKDRDYID
ncbi:recombinase family protein [Paenibacillus sp. NAIST15-1]|uniref:recombinase family protein n=1 Tax=Paenibacillus sp. NAIST15-1 TaxID=1605994 RepID=UPI00086B3079|nr:recombinase family protein [Paenibacillus sp. NAIST15-1]GAV11366.1 putative site-specific integrase/resolvase [Paenibacillus sp. NAIST15-1]